MEIEIGKEAIRRGAEYVNKGIDSVSLRLLRKYFNIDNTFVLRKLALILFPFNNSDWASDGEDNPSRPELYIPMMSFVSYVLLRALRLGLDGVFSPEKLGIVLSRSLFLELVCVTVMKVSGYFVDVSLDVLDVVSYSGYKYVVVVGLQLNVVRYMRVIVGAYLYVSLFVFLSRSLKRRVVHGGISRMRRVYYLFVIVVAQEFIVFVMS